MLHLYECYTCINISIQIHLKSESCRLINLIYINNTMPYVAKKAFCYKIARLNALLLLLEKNVSEFHRLYASLIYFVVVILWFVSPKLNCRVYFTISMPSLSWVKAATTSPSVHKSGRSIACTSHYSTSALLLYNELKRHHKLYHRKPFSATKKKGYIYISASLSPEFSIAL